MTAAEMRNRTKAFALRCIRLGASLSGTPAGRIIAKQLVRCGTSVGANYRAACHARSKAEFAAKLGIVEEEADESAFWMELAMEGRLKPARLVEPLHAEAIELVRIVCASVRTSRSRTNSQFAIANSQ